MTLLTLLVSVAIGGITVVAVATILTHSSASSAKLRTRADRNAAQVWLLSTVDCAETTRNLTSCTPGQPVALKRRLKDGSVVDIVKATGSKSGSLTVRAECNAAGDGFVVRAARLKAGRAVTSVNPADYEPDPLTGQVETFASEGSLLFREPSGGATAQKFELCSLASTGPRRTEAANAPLEASRCAGTVDRNHCQTPWFVDVRFAQPFDAPPAVTVTMVNENNRCACGCTVDRAQAQATNVTRTGFRMICATSPLNTPTDNGPCYAALNNWWNPSECTWTAYEK